MTVGTTFTSGHLCSIWLQAAGQSSISNGYFFGGEGGGIATTKPISGIQLQQTKKIKKKKYTTSVPGGLTSPFQFYLLVRYLHFSQVLYRAQKKKKSQ